MMLLARYQPAPKPTIPGARAPYNYTVERSPACYTRDSIIGRLCPHFQISLVVGKHVCIRTYCINRDKCIDVSIGSKYICIAVDLCKM